MDSGFGSTDISIPAQVLVLARGRPVRVVWHNGVGGVTCEFEDAHQRAEAGEIDPAEWDEAHRPLDLRAALALVRDIPDVDKLVVCHGDTCAPNTLIDDSGNWSGHVDFPSMGAADRWADLAIATLSTTWNYGPGWEQSVLDAYGIEAGPGRARYYRALWDLDP